MKRITMFLTLTALMMGSSLMRAAEINVTPSQDLTAIVRAAQDDDVITLTEAGVYMLDSIKPWINSITIQAAPGLAAKPIIRMVQDPGTGGKTQFYPKAGGYLNLDGIVFDGNRSAYYWLTVQQEGMADVTVNNCDFINMINPAAAAGSGVIFVAKKLNSSIVNNLAGSLTVTNCTFSTVNAGLFFASSASYLSVEFSNCLIKGPLKSYAFSNYYQNSYQVRPDTYKFDHVTFDGCNFREFMISSGLETNLSNVILANNTTTTVFSIGSQGMAGNLYNHCAVYNYAANLSSLTNSSTLTINPQFDTNGIATAPEYVNAGSDSKTIGYYDAGQIIPWFSGVKTVKATSFSVYSDGNSVIVTGAQPTAEYSIYGISGAQLMKGKVESGKIAAGSLQKGIYLMRINGETAKFSVQ